MALCRDHRLVVALQWLQCVHKLPLRESALHDIQVYRVNNLRRAEPDIRAWRRTGGLYIRNYSCKNDYGYTEGMLFVECPFSLAQWETEAMPCMGAAVIYQPPSWLEHENTLVDTHPPAEVARRFWQAMDIVKGRDRKPLHDAMLKIMGLPDSGVVCVSKSEFYKTANISARQMSRISYVDAAILDKQRGGHYGNAVILRFRPEKEPQAALFDWLEANCPRYLNWHVIRGNEPGEEFPDWKRTLRNMSYAGFVQREDEVNFYALSGAKPDFTAYDAALKMARVRLKEVVKFVAGLPLLPVAPRSESRSSPEPA